MANIKITLLDGTVEEFLHQGRSGGSYTKTVRYEGGMVIVTDEEYRETAFPMSQVLKVESEPHRGYF